MQVCSDTSPAPPSRRPTDILISSLDKQSPIFADGNAWIQAPDPGVLPTSKRALDDDKPTHPEEFSRRCCILSLQMASSQAHWIMHKVGLGGRYVAYWYPVGKGLRKRSLEAWHCDGGGGEWWKSRVSLDGQKPKKLTVQDPQDHEPKCPCSELVGKLASTVRLIINIFDKVSYCIPSSALKVESSQPGNVRMRWTHLGMEKQFL